MADNKYTFTGGTGPEEPKPKDTDLDHDSPHHTLGKGPLQAASGVHKHTIADVTDMPSDGLPHTHTEYSPTGHTHSAPTNVDTVDNMHFNWNDRGTWPTYFWVVDNYGDSYLAWSGRLDERFASVGHGHTIPRMGTTVTTSDGNGGCLISPGAWGGAGVPVIVNGDYPAHQRAPHIAGWSAAGGWISITNLNTNQVVRINWVVG
jgi:hypothetical protein